MTHIDFSNDEVHDEPTEQHFLIINADKKEYIHPHKFGDGLNLLEFACNKNRTMTALALLLRQSTSDAGKDYRGENSMVGSWAGDRVTIISDIDQSDVYVKAVTTYHDVSEQILAAMLDDDAIAEDLTHSAKHAWRGSGFAKAMAVAQVARGVAP